MLLCSLLHKYKYVDCVFHTGNIDIDVQLKTVSPTLVKKVIENEQVNRLLLNAIFVQRLAVFFPISNYDKIFKDKVFHP